MSYEGGEGLSVVEKNKESLHRRIEEIDAELANEEAYLNGDFFVLEGLSVPFFSNKEENLFETHGYDKPTKEMAEIRRVAESIITATKRIQELIAERQRLNERLGVFKTLRVIDGSKDSR